MRTVIFDLDGVIRQFDASLAVATAERHQISLERLVRTPFERDRHRRLVTGQLTRADWVLEVGEALGHPQAAQDWLTGNVGYVDEAVLAVVDQLRANGVPLAILTNGTDVIDHELRTLGIRDRFDHVVSTWDLGVAKPDPEAFIQACARIGVDPADTFFTDDRPDNVEAAAGVGMQAHRFDGVEGLTKALGGLLRST